MRGTLDYMEELAQVALDLVAPGKGILAADESSGTIKKRFDKVGIEDTVENHRKYRELLFTTPEIEKYISGVIMFEETLRQLTSPPASETKGYLFPEYLAKRGIIPGIKVDQGLEDFPDHPSEKITKGLDGLSGRLREYKQLGARFTKWRAVFTISQNLPSDALVEENATTLAEYASVAQTEGFVPIVEPEVLMEGSHSLNDSEIATTRVLKKVFEKLSAKNVNFSGLLLKPNWVHSGLDGPKPTSEEVAEATLRVLKAIVPHEVPGIVFLSGGDSPIDSTEHLNALNLTGQMQQDGTLPWQLSFSFGRALQEPVLAAWLGKDENVKAAQDEFIKRAKLNSLARTGKYSKDLEA